MDNFGSKKVQEPLYLKCYRGHCNRLWIFRIRLNNVYLHLIAVRIQYSATYFTLNSNSCNVSSQNIGVHQEFEQNFENFYWTNTDKFSEAAVFKRPVWKQVIFLIRYLKIASNPCLKTLILANHAFDKTCGIHSREALIYFSRVVPL